METSQKEKELLEARDKYGEKAAAALRAFLEDIGRNFYVWLANLYSPRDCKCNNFHADRTKICLYKKATNGVPLCDGGGFYYSGSARISIIKKNCGYK